MKKNQISVKLRGISLMLVILVYTVSGCDKQTITESVISQETITSNSVESIEDSIAFEKLRTHARKDSASFLVFFKGNAGLKKSTKQDFNTQQQEFSKKQKSSFRHVNYLKKILTMSSVTLTEHRYG